MRTGKRLRGRAVLSALYMSLTMPQQPRGLAMSPSRLSALIPAFPSPQSIMRDPANSLARLASGDILCTMALGRNFSGRDFSPMFNLLHIHLFVHPFRTELLYDL
jgi:hypothetical protein